MKRFILLISVSLLSLGACEAGLEAQERTMLSQTQADTLVGFEEASPTDEDSPVLDERLENIDEADATETEEALPPVPTIRLIGPETIYLKVGDVYREQGAEAFDYADVALSVEIIGKVDTAWVNIYVLEYRATDAYGQSVETTRTVHVTVPDYPDFKDIVLVQNATEIGQTLILDLIPAGDASVFSEVTIVFTGNQGGSLRLSSQNIQSDRVRFSAPVPAGLTSSRYSFHTIEWRIGNINGVIVNLRLVGKLNLSFNITPTPLPTPTPEPSPQAEPTQSLEPTYQALRFDTQVVRAGEVLIARLAYQGDVQGYSYRLNVGVGGVRLDLPLLEISDRELIFSLPITEDSPKGRVSGAQLLWENAETNGLLVNVTWSFNLRIE